MDAVKEVLKIKNSPVKYFISSTADGREVVAHPHWHDAVEILYVINGKAKQQIDKNIFDIEKGDIVIIWHDQIHSSYSIPGHDFEVAVLQFIIDDRYYLDKSIHFRSKVNQANNLYSSIYDMFFTVSNELANKEEGFFHIIKAEIHKFYAKILRNTKNLPVRIEKPHYKKEMITKIFEYIDNNYSNVEISLVSAAEHVHLSVAQFMRVFKSATGMTFKYYLNFYRVQQSFLLLSDNNTITKIAETCGFDNINTYIRLFKLHTGITPTQYAKNISIF